MNIPVIIQARMSSKRFPGKVLYPMNGKPLMMYLLERLRQCFGIDGILVATSQDTSDDAVENFCKANNILCFRGDLENVARRFQALIAEFDVPAFARISADSPLMDPAVVERAVKIFKTGEHDIVTNVLPRSYPKGQSVEVIKSEVFLSAFPAILKPSYCEHIISYFYEHRESFSIYNFSSEKNASGIQLSVDTKEDMKVFEEIIRRMERPHWEYGWEEIIRIREQVLVA